MKTIKRSYWRLVNEDGEPIDSDYYETEALAKAGGEAYLLERFASLRQSGSYMMAANEDETVARREAGIVPSHFRPLSNRRWVGQPSVTWRDTYQRLELTCACEVQYVGKLVQTKTVEVDGEVFSKNVSVECRSGWYTGHVPWGGWLCVGIREVELTLIVAADCSLDVDPTVG